MIVSARLKLLRENRRETDIIQRSLKVGYILSLSITILMARISLDLCVHHMPYRRW
jgi:hypothetical protein